jgi:hypothetical protein
MRYALVIAIAVLLAPAPAHATWQRGGNPIGTGDGFVATASGRQVVVAWTHSVDADHSEVRAQAWTSDGDIAPGWPSSSVVVSDLPGRNFGPAVCEDAQGGVFVAWVNQQLPGAPRFYLQRISDSGGPAVGWAPQGVRLRAGSDYSGAPVVAPDGAGGALVGWFEPRGGRDFNARVIRIDADGDPNGVWPAGGDSIPNAYAVGLAADDQGHVFVSTAEFDPAQASSGMRVHRLDGSAAPDPAWPQAGAWVTEALSPNRIGLFPDGTGGVFAGWIEGVICIDDFAPCPSLRGTTRIQGDGTQNAGWKPTVRAYSNAPDGAGGMLLGLSPGGRPGVLRLDVNGAAMPGWTVSGNDAMTEVVYPTSVWVTQDGSGGAFVVWRDRRTGDDRLYASRLDAQGRLARDWPPTGSFVGSGGSSGDVQLVSPEAGIAVASWQEWTGTELAGYLTALRPGEPGPVAELGPVQEPVGFGVVEVRPHPARGPIVAVVELASPGPARLDLMDAAGRVLETRRFDFGLQSRGAVRFNQARALPPGVYWIHVTQGARRAARRVVLLE